MRISYAKGTFGSEVSPLPPAPDLSWPIESWLREISLIFDVSSACEREKRNEFVCHTRNARRETWQAWCCLRKWTNKALLTRFIDSAVCVRVRLCARVCLYQCVCLWIWGWVCMCLGEKGVHGVDVDVSDLIARITDRYMCACVWNVTPWIW